MGFLESIDKLYYYILFGAIFVIGHFIVQRKDDLKLSLKYYLFSYGIVLLLFSLSIPHIFPGRFEDISDLENKKMLLYNLQRDHEALVYTTESFRDMALVTFAFIGIVIGNVVKYLKIDKVN